MLHVACSTAPSSSSPAPLVFALRRSPPPSPSPPGSFPASTPARTTSFGSTQVRTRTALREPAPRLTLRECC
jgi:hypothetical protein